MNIDELRAETIGKRVERIRKEKGYKNQEELAKAVTNKTERRWIGDLENNRFSTTKLDNLLKLSNKLEVPVSYLLTDIHTLNPDLSALCVALGISEDIALQFESTATEEELSLNKMPQFIFEALYSTTDHDAFNLKAKMDSYIKDKRIQLLVEKSRYIEVFEEALKSADAVDPDSAFLFADAVCQKWDLLQKYEKNKTDFIYNDSQLAEIHHALHTDTEVELAEVMVYFRRILENAVMRVIEGAVSAQDEEAIFTDGGLRWKTKDTQKVKKKSSTAMNTAKI